MKIYLSRRAFDGTDNINVIFQCDQKGEKLSDHFGIIEWIMACDVWGTSVTKYGLGGAIAHSFELPKSMTSYLYSDDFIRLARRLSQKKLNVEVIR